MATDLAASIEEVNASNEEISSTTQKVATSSQNQSFSLSDINNMAQTVSFFDFFQRSFKGGDQFNRKLFDKTHCVA